MNAQVLDDSHVDERGEGDRFESTGDQSIHSSSPVQVVRKERWMCDNDVARYLFS